jgi:cysteine desulfurase/selenocysteine lyase
MIDQVRLHTSSFGHSPEKFEAGTPDVAGAVGLAAAVNYLEGLGRASITSHEQLLTAQLLEGLRAIPAVRILGNPEPAANRIGLVSFTVTGTHPQDIALMLDADGIAIRIGAQCAQPFHRFLGLTASCRVSLGVYNTASEIDRFLASMANMRRRISRSVMLHFP